MKLKRIGSCNSVTSSVSLLIAGFAGAITLTGCIAIGYSGSGGWFIWPGGIGLLFLVLIIALVLRRR